MQPSMFNVRVPLPDRGEVFLMNTFTDAQLLVSTDVVALLDSLERRDAGSPRFNPEEQAALDSIREEAVPAAFAWLHTLYRCNRLGRGHSRQDRR